MKKIFTILAAAAISLSATAQTKTLAPSKFFDNWYVGIEGGAATKTLNNAWMKNLNPTVGVRVGKWITPVIGLQLEANAYFDQKARESHTWNSMFMGGEITAGHGDNVVKKATVLAEMTTNFSNLFGGYKGEPRTFEVIGLAGIGIGHDFVPGQAFKIGEEEDNQELVKAGLDFTFNLGAKKAWQVYVEPSLIWDVADNDLDAVSLKKGEGYCHQFNLNRSAFQVLAGVNYKFMTSNGTHNFALVDLMDQALVDRLNGNINDLRGELSGKDAEIARLKKALDDCEKKLNTKKPEPAPMVTNIMPRVYFKCDKWNIEKTQVANVEMVAEYMKANPNAKVLCKGYASIEGPADHNVDLSVNRANIVRDMLIEKYGIEPSRLTTEGCGATDEHSSVLDFNRVTTFTDVTNK
ncbi:MAG: OmpA family protein [Bacteroidaceae bacterium]|nr:OmpA family protein [Bacteroidaceae bacterium]